MYNIASNVKKHRLYSDFSKVKAVLAAHQFVCWIAGGAARDFCLNREVTEFDLVTDASTEILKILFPKALLVGESFGVLKLPLAEGEYFDLTTFRQESDYFDGRRPTHVSAATPVKDSERRDFTINSMFWDDTRKIIVDYRGGLADLSARRLTCVGNPVQRFSEDYLRIIRLVRFAAQLGFEIEEKTNAAAIVNCPGIQKVSGERIWAEIKKINTGPKWNSVCDQKLLHSIFELVFATRELQLHRIKDRVSDISVILYLLNPGMDFSEVLKERLKVSNTELAEYKAICFLMSNLQKIRVEELAFEVEKNPLYKRQLNVLIESGLVAVSLGEEIKNLLSAFPEPLVVPSEILDLMPNHFISQEMKFIRIAQFKRDFRTKDEAVQYLKKKYADKPEKT